MRLKNETISESLMAGAIAGLAGSFAMNQFQSLWTAASGEKADAGEDATVKTGEAISQGVFDHELTGSEKKWTGPAVHYIFGTLVGAVYGVLAARVPAFRSGYGAVYGTAVWLSSDEIGVPALGLAPPPTQTPAASHVKALASHVVYGPTTELTRRLILRRNR